MNVPTLSRRAFLGGSAAAAAAAAGGCATNPVSGRRQLMLLSQSDEIRIDREQSPHQISYDYGPLQDAAANRYIASVGTRLTPLTHRPDMPYSFRGVNAVYVNAYAFPGGTIAVTRGLLLEMDSEAQLAALLGHEIAHVAARHSAAAMSTAIAAQLGLALVGAAAVLVDESYADIAMGLGGAGAFLFLASYSRNNEREADKLGLKYMTAADYHPEGMVALMDTLRGLRQRQPGVLEVMFSTHPMSEERYRDAARRAGRMADSAGARRIDRERYLDHTAAIRARAGAIRALQEGERALSGNKPDEAEARFGAALKLMPEDYTALLLMAKCLIARERFGEASTLAARAREVYPEEPQAWHVGGMADLRARHYAGALAAFKRYSELLPGNPNTVFFTGYTLDRMQRRAEAMREYRNYLALAPSGEHAEFVRGRLAELNQAS